MIDFLERVYVVLGLLYLSAALLPIVAGDLGGSAIEMRSDPYLLLLQGIMYSAMLFFILRNFRNFLFFLTRSTWIVLLVGLAVASTMWSVNPDITLRRSIVLALTAIFGIYFASRFSVREQLRMVGMSIGLAIVLSAGCAILFPKLGVMHGVYEGSWKGVFVHKNALGREMAFGCVVFAVLMVSDWISKRFGWLGFGASAGLLILSKSRTACVVVVPLLLLVWILKKYDLQMRTVGIFVFTSIFALVALAPIIADDDIREGLFGSIGRDTTLSGRTLLWSTVWDSIMQHPWLGFGFGSFWHGTQGPSLVILNAVRWNVAQSHNGFLDLVLDIGFVGLAVFLVGYGIACYRACQLLRNHASMGFLWPLVFLVFLLVYNFTESGLLFQNSLFLALYAAVYAQSSVQEHFSETTETLDDGRTADGTMPLLALDIEPGL